MESQLLNRLLKNEARVNNYLKQNKITAFRLYDQDIPEMPFTIDSYEGHLVLNDRTESWENGAAKLEEAQEICQALLPKEKNLFIKRRESQTRTEKYEKLDKASFTCIVTEGKLKFEVNLSDYIDTGLFLDHRPFRKLLSKLKNQPQVLNLFSYTCSLGVAAASAGCTTTNIDLSEKYLRWGEKNYQLNDIDPAKHKFLATDILNWLQISTTKYNLIICDPPSFSNSKKMADNFDVQRDHKEMLMKLHRNLLPSGEIYFSNNLRSFKLDQSLSEFFEISDLSQDSIPPDFQDQKIHKLYLLRLIGS